MPEALRVRTIEGDDRDIEFAVVDDDIWLLQARPVTGIGGMDIKQHDGASDLDWSVEDADRPWTLVAGIGAVEPLRRFEQDLIRAYMEHARSVFDDVGAMRAQGHIVTFGAEVAERVQRHAALGQRYRDRGTTYYDEVIEPEVMSVLDAIGGFRRPVSEGLSDRLRFLERAIEAYGRVNGDLHWRQLPRDPQAPQWPELFHELTGRPEIESGVLLQAVENDTMRMVRRLRGLARIVHGESELRTLFEERAFDRMRGEPVRSHPATERFRPRFSAPLRDFGRRNGRSYGSQSSFLTPTWNPRALDSARPRRELCGARPRRAGRPRTSRAGGARAVDAGRPSRDH